MMSKKSSVLNFILSIIVFLGAVCLTKISFQVSDILWVLLLETMLIMLFAVYKKWCLKNKMLPYTITDLLKDNVAVLSNLDLYYFGLCRILFSDVVHSVIIVSLVNLVLTGFLVLNGRSRDAVIMFSFIIFWTIGTANLDVDNDSLSFDTIS